MLKVKVKDGESIERALKTYKRKVNQTHLIREIREKQEYKKPGEVRRKIKEKAAYRERYLRNLEI